MKQLVVDPDSGFLEQPNTLNGFSTEKKLKLLELMEENPHRSGIQEACKIIGIAPSTIYRHLERDAQFRTEWDRLKKNFAYRVEDVLAHCALDPKKTLDRIVYLKAYMPDKYNPQTRIDQQVSITFDPSLIAGARDRQRVIDVGPQSPSVVS